MNAAQIIEVTRKARAAYRKDAANRYALIEPIVLPRVKCRAVGVAPFEWDGPYIAVVPDEGDETVTITVKPYTAESGVCDGCSLSPDLAGCTEAALVHDPWYLEMEDMAAQIGIPLADLRRLGDAVFGALCSAWGAPGPVARLYHGAVRLFGGLYHRVKGRGILALLLAAATLAAGCAIPDILDPGGVPPPVFQKEVR